VSNLDGHDSAFEVPRLREIDVTDELSLVKLIAKLGGEMKAAAKRCEPERAAALRPWRATAAAPHAADRQLAARRPTVRP
jgi:hypothetical protein